MRKYYKVPQRVFNEIADAIAERESFSSDEIVSLLRPYQNKPYYQSLVSQTKTLVLLRKSRHRQI